MTDLKRAIMGKRGDEGRLSHVGREALEKRLWDAGYTIITIEQYNNWMPSTEVGHGSTHK